TLLLIGSWVGYIDIYAVARGRVEPSGRTKIVQPPNSGKVEAIFVRDGDAVVAGQELIRLDPADAQSKLTELPSRRLIYEAENVRYTAEVAAVRDGSYRHDAALPLSSDAPKDLIDRENTELQAGLGELSGNLAELKAKLAASDQRSVSFQDTVAEHRSMIEN